jgi:hypothetical protein
MGGGEVITGGNKTDWHGGIAGCNVVQVVHPIGEGLDWAKWTDKGGVVHGAAPFSISLIINIEAYGIRLLKLRQRGIVVEDLAGFEETDVLASKLDGPCFGASRWHRVFAWSQ